MDEEFEVDDEVEIEYESARSGNVVSRTGTVVQVPDKNGRTILFVETDENQLTGVGSDSVFSVTSQEYDPDSDGGSRVKRTSSLGTLVSVTRR